MDGEAYGRPARPVPADDRVAVVVDGALVGRVSIRYELNDHLWHEGGHIGYGIRPAHRRRGYATATLARSVEHLHEVSVHRVLVVCDDDNLASTATIERCGGVLEDVRIRLDGSPVRRYWIG